MSLVTMGTIAGGKPGSSPPATNISFVQQIASQQVTSSSSPVFSVTANTSAGNLVVLGIAMGNSRTVSSVTDSKGNSYTVHHQSGGSQAAALTTSVLSSALTTSDTISVSLSGSTTSRLVAIELANQNTTPLDKVNSNNASSVTTLSTGSTGTLSATPEIVFAVITLNGSSGGFSAEPSGYTALTSPISNALLAGYKTVNATTALDEAYAWNTTRNGTALIATFK